MIRLARALVPLLLAGTLQGQTKVPYSSLGVVNATLRFFPSDGSFPAAPERVYPASFDSATTQYINVELSIAYPRIDSPVSFDLICRYVGPQGENRGTPNLPGSIEAGWSGSMHAGGWGSKGGGHYPVGNYQVTCYEGAAAVASGSFAVTRDSYDVPAIKGVVTRIRMFEGPSNLPQGAQREYPAQFDGGTARVIATEIWLDFPAAAEKTRFAIDCSYRYPSGETKSFTIDTYVEPGWIDSTDAGGLGSDVPGKWAQGVYHVTCRHLGRVIAERSFTVY